MPETNRVPKLYNVAAVLLLQYMAHVMLFPMLNVLYEYFTSVPPAVCLQYTVWLFGVVL
jgi:hypothetical protein